MPTDRGSGKEQEDFVPRAVQRSPNDVGLERRDPERIDEI
jgi:hypothetical protein